MALLLNMNKLFTCGTRSTFQISKFGVRIHSDGLSSFRRIQSYWQQPLNKAFQNLKCVCRSRAWQGVHSKTSMKASLAFASVTSIGILKQCQVASCEYKPSKNRLKGISVNENIKEAHFPWKVFWSFVWHDIWFLILAILSALGAAYFNIQIPIQLGDVVNVVAQYTTQNDGNLPRPSHSFLQEITKPVLRLTSMFIAQGCLTFSYISLLGALGERTAARIRKQLFSSLIKQDIQFFDTRKTGEVINRLTTDVQDFKSSFKLVISQGLRSTTQCIGCVVSLLYMSPKLTAVMVVVVPSVIGVGTLLGSLLRELSRRAQAQVSKATAVADEAISNVRTVRAFAMENKEIDLYSDEVEHSSRLNQWLAVSIGAFQGLSNIALNAIVLGTLYVGGYLVSQNEIRAGDLMAFMVATQTIQRSLAQMSLLFGQAVRGMSAGARVFEYLEAKPLMPMSGGKKISFHSLHGHVNFNNVGFSYPSRPDQTVLKDFNLDIPGGKVVALVGLSGNGKSTVACLLERFYDVNSGSITLDGHDLRDLDPSWLRGRVLGFINQEPVLFAATIMENIRYGQPDATDQEVIEAAKMANAHGFIKSFPDGYNTVLGERGVTVSGGQKQRIAIARALIKNPSLLILDEATSALDTESEKIVQNALDKVIKGRTVLVIAHRLSTIKNADIIAVVANGQIAEMGRHEELKKKRGLYWQLIRQQDESSSATS